VTSPFSPIRVCRRELDGRRQKVKKVAPLQTGISPCLCRFGDYNTCFESWKKRRRWARLHSILPRELQNGFDGEEGTVKPMVKRLFQSVRVLLSGAVSA